VNPSLAIGTARAKRNRVLTLLAAVALLVFPARAIGHEGHAERSLAALRNVGLGAAPQSVVASSSGDAVLAATGRAGTIKVPKDGLRGVAVDPVHGAPLTIGLPAGTRGSAARRLGDAEAVYGNTAPHADTVVQILDDGATQPTGVRILTILYSAAARSDYAFRLSLGPGEAVRASGAGYVVVDRRGEVAARIAPAWARDATGAAVPARFSLEGSTLHLHVDHAGTTHPVVADPTVVLDGGAVAPPPFLAMTPTEPVPTTTTLTGMDPVSIPATISVARTTTTLTGMDPVSIPATISISRTTTTTTTGAPGIDVNDPAALQALVSQLLAGGPEGAALWARLSPDVRQAVVEFVQGIDSEGSSSLTVENDMSYGISLANPAFGVCRLAGYTLRYRTRFHVTLWTFAAGFYFCADGIRITYVSDPIVRASTHWGWQYHGTDNVSWIGGKGFPRVALYVQGKFTACIPYLPCNLKEMHPWVNVVGAANGSWTAAGHV
jgi:hypothetical protein